MDRLHLPSVVIKTAKSFLTATYAFHSLEIDTTSLRVQMHILSSTLMSELMTLSYACYSMRPQEWPY